jgi:hypothetical protein
VEEEPIFPKRFGVRREAEVIGQQFISTLRIPVIVIGHSGGR